MRFLLVAFTVLALATSSASYAEEVQAFGGEVKLKTPEAWKSVQPRSRIVQKEYAVKKEGVEGAARLTMMAAAGDINANISRWVGQFKNASGGSAKDSLKVEKLKLGSNEVHFVQLEGTFKESMGGGPFFPGKTVMREDYQMLGAIIVSDGRKFFVKMTGPKAIVSENKDKFKAMIQGK